jgi:DNA-binding transcriptional LysR family regulator
MIRKSDLIDIDEVYTCFTPWVKWHDPKALTVLDQKKPIITVPDFVAIKELVLSDQGVAVVPRYLIEKEIRSKKIIQVLPNSKPYALVLTALLFEEREIDAVKSCLFKHCKI